MRCGCIHPCSYEEYKNPVIKAYSGTELVRENKGRYVSPYFCHNHDNTLIYEQILREVFEDVRFINSTMTRGIPY